ncbi:MAG: M1 family metallopeptidase, partial [Gemmatimonadales bacterium]
MLPWNRKASALICGALGLVATDAGLPSGENAAPFDVLSYVISVELEAGVDTIVARTDIGLRISREGVDRLRFDLVGLTVDSTFVGDEAAPFQRGPADIAVSLGRRRAGVDTLSVSVFYHGAPQDGLVFRRNVYGRPTVFADNWPERARFWFPSIDHPSDKATVEFRVLAPAGWSVVANGRLLETRARDAGRVLTVWRAERPIPVYTMVVGAADMVVREVGEFCPQSRRCVPITRWSFVEDEDRAERLFRRAPEIVAFFDSLVGPFPYAKLALVQSTTRYGGMENASAIFFAERLSEGRRGDGLVAHEIAHQWFGDAVTETEWPDIWLSEGFATYFASVFFEFVDGEQAGEDARARAERTYMGSASDVERPILDVEPDDPFRLLNANSYQKGAWVLHMLRRLIGDEAFFAGIRSY